MHQNTPQRARIGLCQQSHPFDCQRKIMDGCGGEVQFSFGALLAVWIATHAKCGIGVDAPIGPGGVIGVEEQHLW
jgi:hypothetical protein